MDIVGSCSGTYGEVLNNTIISPNHPQNYDLNQECDWKIAAPTGFRVRLQLTDFKTEPCCDKLKIYDGLNSGASLLHMISGNDSSNREFVTTGKSMYLLFTSNEVIAFSGFRGLLTYTRGRFQTDLIF